MSYLWPTLYSLIYSVKTFNWHQEFRRKAADIDDVRWLELLAAGIIKESRSSLCLSNCNCKEKECKHQDVYWLSHTEQPPCPWSMYHASNWWRTGLHVRKLMVVVYLDDIIVFGQTLEEHKERLMKVLERLNLHRQVPVRSTTGQICGSHCLWGWHSHRSRESGSSKALEATGWS